jgi:hypothetical protein
LVVVLGYEFVSHRIGAHARLNLPDGVEAWLMNPANQEQDESRGAA